jgi:hypothetical protein
MCERGGQNGQVQKDPCWSTTCTKASRSSVYQQIKKGETKVIQIIYIILNSYETIGIEL